MPESDLTIAANPHLPPEHAWSRRKPVVICRSTALSPEQPVSRTNHEHYSRTGGHNTAPAVAGGAGDKRHNPRLGRNAGAGGGGS